MKLFFLKQDSLYKIFTTLEKVPKKSQIQIFIESENQFFDNPWRSKQIEKVAHKKWLKIEYVAQNDQQIKFFEHNKLAYSIKKESRIRRFFNLMYRFFFNIKKFHLKIYEHRNYSSLAIFWAETLFIIIVWYSIYALILPQTTVTLTPSYNLDEIVYNFRYLYPDDIDQYPNKERHITIPLYTGRIESITNSLSVDKVARSDWSIIKGKLRLINTTNTPYSLIPQTQIVDEFWIEYTTLHTVDLPAASWEWKAAISEVNIVSKDNPENIDLVLKHSAEIDSKRKFIIKNLRASRYTEQVYGELLDSFHLEQYNQSGFILLNEIQELQESLYNELNKRKKEHIYSYTPSEEQIIIPFEELLQLKECHYEAQWDSKDVNQLRKVTGTIDCALEYSYINKSDIVEGVRQYIAQRSTEAQEVISIQNNFINFFSLLTGDYNSFIIPTQVNVIESYNLSKDINNVIPNIRNQIIGLPKEEALNAIEFFDEIEKSDIKISPFRYSNVTTIKSRIRIKTTQ